MKGYRRVLGWCALPITDRRWAAPLSAVALGFGLFAGVAIGPGASGTFATGAAQIIEIPGLAAEMARDVESAGAPSSRGPALAAAPEGGAGLSAAPAADSGAFAPPPISEPEDTAADEVTTAPAPAQDPVQGKGEEEQPGPDEEVLTGVVVHLNKAAGSYVVAEEGGALVAVHAAKAPRPGTEVEVPVRPLANGTYREGGRRLRLGTQTRAELGGIVTHVDPTPSAPTYTVSERGASLLVRVHPDPAGLAAPLPALGSFAHVVVAIERPEPSPSEVTTPAAEPLPELTDAPSEPDAAVPICAPDPAAPPPVIHSPTVLWQRQVEAEGTPLTYGDFAGVVSAVCPESGELLVSADDVRAGGEDLRFGFSAEAIDVAGLQVGDSVLVTASIAPDGALTLLGLADDEHLRGADEVESLQGDIERQGPRPSDQAGAPPKPSSLPSGSRKVALRTPFE